MGDRIVCADVQRRAANPWLWRPVPRASAGLRLFCFAHAGGSAAAYRLWAQALPEAVELVAIQLPARGNRLQEPAMDRLDELADTIAGEIRSDLDLPYVFFGHSMGALLAFSVARRLRELGVQMPEHLLLSGRRAPALPRTEPDLHRLSDARFVEEIGRRYGGIPPEILAHPEVLQLLLPALRADIAALETYTYRSAEPLPMPMTIYGGTEDSHATLEGLDAWREETSGAFRSRMFPGGHFYLEQQFEALLGDISTVIAPIAERGRTRVVA